MSTRLHKIQDLLHKEIAHLLINNLNNPVISKKVTISGVRLSKDLRYSEIYFTTFDDNVEKIQKELNNASKYIRAELSKKVYLKRIPSIKFCYDKSSKSSQRIDVLIDKITREK